MIGKLINVFIELKTTNNIIFKTKMELIFRKSNIGLGRRKEAIARVFLLPGEGNITINKKSGDKYLQYNETYLNTVWAPLETLNLEKQFDIVLALGVLVTRVRDYNLFIEYFVKKMVKCARKYVVFNIISDIEASSLNYSQPNAVGHSTVLSVEILNSIISSLDCATCRVEPLKIFPDATDLFVYIELC